LAIWGNGIRWNETKHVELEQFWHAFTSRGFDSVSWAFLYLITNRTFDVVRVIVALLFHMLHDFRFQLVFQLDLLVPWNRLRSKSKFVVLFLQLPYASNFSDAVSILAAWSWSDVKFVEVIILCNNYTFTEVLVFLNIFVFTNYMLTTFLY